MSKDDAYRAAGVDYDALDAGKRLAMAKALSTSSLLAARGGRALDASRGEPAFVFELGAQTLAFVVEGLGTKSIIARHVLEQQGIDRFADVAYDTVAAIVNDLCCVGALPLVVNAYFATGASEWYLQRERSESLLEGWRGACADAGCVWGGGESPSLPGMLAEHDIELAGAAVGAVPDGHSAIMGEHLAAGDEIVLVASSGLHANGASLARSVASGLDDGYATKLGGATLGEALLEPSVMYVPLVAALLEQELPLSYLSHITGHGLLKLMRPDKPLRYRIERLPEVPPVLSYLVAQAGMDPPSAYSTFNMGAGFAVYCAAGAGTRVVEIADGLGLDALLAGSVEAGPREVVLEPIGVRFGGDRLEALDCSTVMLRFRVSIRTARSRVATWCAQRVRDPGNPPRSNGHNLNATTATYKVCARNSPMFHCEPAGDLDVAGPAWLRIYPDRGGPVHQKRERNLMRRASTCLAVLGLALLALPGVASALPTVKFKAEAVPIPGFPGTGNILGAGTALKAEYEIAGTEYLGSPPPVIGVNFYLPSGSKLHPTGFPTCTKATLEQFGPIKCPKGSAAGPIGTVLGFVTFGGERVEETAELSSFYAPGGGFLFFTDGHSPVSLEIIAPGHYKNFTGGGGFGPELITTVPLVASVPGAPYASVKTINVKAGSAYKSGGKTIYYGRVPTKCPKGGFPLKTEVIFAENGEESKPETATAFYKAPCPRK